MLKIDIRGLDATRAMLRGLADKKIKKAMVSALNAAAYAGATAAKSEMDRAFDRPTPWVKGAVQYIKAGLAGSSVRNPGVFDQFGKPAFEKIGGDRMTAVIDLDRWGNKQQVSVSDVLRAEIEGGGRRHKRHEVALQRVGILPAGMFIVPGGAAQLDAYGNMNRGQINQIISWFRAFGEQGYRANMTDKTRGRLGKGNKRTGARGFSYVLLRNKYGKLPAGIYQRVVTGFGSALRPVMVFVKAPRYQKKYDFYGVAKKAALLQLRKSFDEYLGQMLRERSL